MPHVPADFRRDYLLRLPLPLAQLYSRAYNAKDARSRHDNAFYLFEALIKLATVPAVACYLSEASQGTARIPALDRLLAQLALPSLGQWVAILRELSRYFAARVDAAAHPLGRLGKRLDETRGDLPATAALYRRIKNGPDGASAGNSACSLAQLFEALVQYRNGVFGHGAGRFDAFFAAEMGPLLFPAVNELLQEGELEPLGPVGSRLAYITELRKLDDGRTQVGLRELIGLQGERTAPLELSADQAQSLLPNRIVVLWPGRAVPLRLDPLLLYRESELAEEVLFLNRDRNGRQVEYLSYTTGRTERDKSMLPALAALLSQVTNRRIDGADLERLGERSLAETPSVETWFAESPPTGQQLGDYELLAELGRGGMGVVYLAKQLSLGRLVALKMLPGDLGADDVATARFRREIRHLARCDHPNIVKVLGSGTLPDGRLYYAMEYVPGSDLGHVWRELAEQSGGDRTATLSNRTWAQAVMTAGRKRRQKTASSSPGGAPSVNVDTPGASRVPAESVPLPPLPELPALADDSNGYVRRVVALIRDAAQALQTVHEQGIVHRDVSPDNLMLSSDGSRVVLMDFGLAKGETRIATSISEPGGFVGKLRYAAPEQLASAKLKVGPPADVRSLGVTLWELLTRKRLFADVDDEAALAAQIYGHDVPHLRTIDLSFDRDLEAIVARACERRADDRIQTAALLAAYLQLYLDGKPLPIRTPGLGELAKRWIRERQMQAVTMAASLALIAAITALAFFVVNRTKNEAVQLASDLEVALHDSREAQKETQDALIRNHRDRGVAECRTGKIDYGMNHLLRAYETATENRLLRDEALRLLAGWSSTQGIRIHHGDSVVNALAFSPDGKLVVTGGFDNQVRLWDADTGRPIGGKPMTHPSGVAALTFSPDGRQILSAAGNAAYRWDVETTTQIGGSLNHDENDLKVQAVAFSPDGSTIATGDSRGTIQLWTASTGKPKRPPLKVTEEEPPLNSMTTGYWRLNLIFSPDGKTLVVGGATEEPGLQKLRCFDVTTGKLVGQPFGSQSIWPLSFSPDEKTILTAGGGLQLWDATTQESNHTAFDAIGDCVPLRFVRSAVFSQDGTRVWAVSSDGVLHNWDARTGEVRLHQTLNLRDINAASFSRDGRRLLAADPNGVVHLIAIPFGRAYVGELRRTDRYGRIVDVNYGADGKTLLVLSQGLDDGEKPRFVFRQWAAGTLSLLENPVESPELDGEVLGFHSGRKIVLTGKRIWDAATGKSIAPLEDPEPFEHLVNVAISADGETMLANGEDDPGENDVHRTGLWDLTSGKRRGGERIAGELVGADLATGEMVYLVALSPDGTLAATASQRYTGIADSLETIVTLWNAATSKRVGEPLPLKGSVDFLAFGPAGRLFYIGSEEPSGYTVIRAYKTDTRTKIGTDMRHNRKVRKIVFSPDETLMVTAAVDGDTTVRLWNAATGEPVGKPLQHESDVADVAFSPNGLVLLTSTVDGVYLWNIKTADSLGYPVTKVGATKIGFSPDGQSFFGISEGEVHVWRIPQPFAHESERLQAWVEVRTGHFWDQDILRPLSHTGWLESWERLTKLGGPPNP